ncbi:exostosin family protein [Tripterygium wilfordii]|uniref:Exostosin family protein n=1 Tax=Tripterygium wilfordii TaxID=458696 RepID=A0A7J7D2I9_TRIWF|nr:acyltransferase-like protein At1g54570, chloroplastic [Tripterygium wilfordii]KAF5740554.1 exostosin family protein [Tripterygium wilfordii]
MASVVNFCVPNTLATNYNCRSRGAVQVHSLGGNDSTVLSSDSVVVNEGSLIEEKQRSDVLVDGGNGRLKSKSRVEKKWVKDDMVSKHLEVLWDDGYGTSTVKDYLEGAKEMIKPDGGPPRWFCPIECGQPLADSPILLFLPGLDGVGLGLILHHKPLGRVFEIRCLHIPVQDRTPFEGLLKFVEETVRLEHALSPSKPIYLVGDSFGGCLALAVAARIPTIDLILILANPATSFDRSQLQPILPLLEALPDELHFTVPYLLCSVMGDPMKMAMADIEYRLPPRLQIEQLQDNLLGLLPLLSGLSDIIPKDTLLWKLKLLKTAAAYANSRLHAVKAEVLVLASGKDNLLPSRDEAHRLKNSLQNCIVRNFKENGHTLLLERSISLLTLIKGTCKYRRLKRRDYVADFLPPSMSEFKYGFDEVVGLLRFATGSTFLSTLKDGKIVKGLAGVPIEGPVMLVGYHNLMGLELFSLIEEFLREKKIMVRGVAHPVLFSEKVESSSSEFFAPDWIALMGAVPVAPNNLFKLLSTKSHVLLYPGGVREALHHKGEEYKLFWPDQPEFVRMAARFGATIVPFGAIGEDDMFELALDYNDYMKIPVLNDYIRDASRKSMRIRDESLGEVASQDIFVPGILPKIPGRFYYLFGKPIETKGMEEALKDKENAKQLYDQIKYEVESNIAYLLKKREEDPYRNILDRTLYRMLHSPLHEVPAFKP